MSDDTGTKAVQDALRAAVGCLADAVYVDTWALRVAAGGRLTKRSALDARAWQVRAGFAVAIRAAERVSGTQEADLSKMPDKPEVQYRDGGFHTGGLVTGERVARLRAGDEYMLSPDAVASLPEVPSGERVERPVSEG